MLGAGRPVVGLKPMRKLVVGIGLALLGGCQGSQSFASVQEGLSQLNDKQDAILGRLSALEDKLDKLPTAAAKPPPKQRKKRPPHEPSAAYKATLGEAHIKGPADALVTIVEWSDFECPYCSRVNPTIEQARKEYGDKIRVAFKHNPLGFHKRALPGALAAEAAGRQGADKFWKMHDKLFANSKQLSDDNFATWADEIGLDVERFKKDMKDPVLAKKVQADQAQGAMLGVSGTPAFFINGRFLNGAQAYPAFKKIIDEELAKAQKLTASGVPKTQIYANVMKSARSKV